MGKPGKILIREGDIECIERNLRSKPQVATGRQVIDSAGKRVFYNVDRRGRVTITHYEGGPNG